jgi:hypothetical protein
MHGFFIQTLQAASTRVEGGNGLFCFFQAGDKRLILAL